MTPLVTIKPSLPFIVSACLCLVGWFFLLFIKNDYPENEKGRNSFLDNLKRFGKAWKYAWVAFLPPLAYGFLESSLNGSFPVFALRNGIEVAKVSVILSGFSIGGIITQLPLGMMSDKYGRRPILTTVLFIGFISFTTATFLEHSFIGLFLCFLIAGMAVGSTFSLGISYMSDLLPKSLLPTGNLMCGIFFSLGSLSGPIIGGIFIQLFKHTSFFYIVSFILFFITFVLFSFGKRTASNHVNF